MMKAVLCRIDTNFRPDSATFMNGGGARQSGITHASAAGFARDDRFPSADSRAGIDSVQGMRKHARTDAGIQTKLILWLIGGPLLQNIQNAAIDLPSGL